jgi:hypothetical protein
MLGVGEAVEQHRSVQSVVIITMSEQEVPVSVAQRIIIKFLSGEGVKPAQILRRLTEQFKGLPEEGRLGGKKIKKDLETYMIAAVVAVILIAAASRMAPF